MEAAAIPAAFRQPRRGALSRRAGFLLVQLGTHRHRRFAERLAPFDLHPRHFGMLNQLAVNEGQSQQALSNALGIHRSAVVALVDDLEHRGLAERRRDPADRRAYTLFLTPDRPRAAGRARSTWQPRTRPSCWPPSTCQSVRTLISLLQRLAESQGLTAGVHPDLEPPEGDDDQPAPKDGTARHARTRRTSPLDRLQSAP